MSPAAARPDPLAELAATLSDGAAFLETLSGPFRRAWRLHPLRGSASGWGELTPVPWAGAGRFHAAEIDPGSRLDYHTGTIYPQDAASQLPVVLLAPRAGETIIDCCAAPGSKSTQIGLQLGGGLLVCCDASRPRRRSLRENLARQGVGNALVTPMALNDLARRFSGCADGVLVDAPCSGHAWRSVKQVVRMAAKQLALLRQASGLVRPGGRLVYSTCTPYQRENEGVIDGFLDSHPDWQVVPCELPGVDADLAGLGACRLWPQRQGTESFFACLLQAPDDGPASSLQGEPAEAAVLAEWQLPASWHCWQRGELLFAGSAAAAACALPSEARGLLLGRPGQWQPWAVQALIAAGHPSEIVDQETACRLWAGEEAVAPFATGICLRTEQGAPLGQLDAAGRRLHIGSRLTQAGLV